MTSFGINRDNFEFCKFDSLKVIYDAVKTVFGDSLLSKQSKGNNLGKWLNRVPCVVSYPTLQLVLKAKSVPWFSVIGSGSAAILEIYKIAQRSISNNVQWKFVREVVSSSGNFSLQLSNLSVSLY